MRKSPVCLRRNNGDVYKITEFHLSLHWKMLYFHLLPAVWICNLLLRLVKTPLKWILAYSTLLQFLLFSQAWTGNCWKCSWAGRDPVQLCFTNGGIFLYDVTFPAKAREGVEWERKRFHCKDVCQGTMMQGIQGEFHRHSSPFQTL